MKEFLSVVTRKGQITVPAEIRKQLGLKEGDKVALTMDDHQVCLGRAGSVVERTAGLLKGKERPLSAEELRSVGEEAIAEETTHRSEGRA